MIKRFEASTLEEACSAAAADFGCRVDELQYDIVQHPSRGFFGFFAKKAIIIAAVKSAASKEPEPKEGVAKSAKESAEDKEDSSPKRQSGEVVENFFSTSAPKQRKVVIEASELEEQIRQLMNLSCFDIDTVEVDIEENTAYVFIDGEDAALLIGKEGYRYNALSYMLFNWINGKYGLYLKLEIAQFLASQQDMIKHQLQPVVEHVTREGWGRTRELNGILVQIALEHLRDTFPNKYVAIKRAKSGERYIVINEFNKK